jgi:hypothetical protein
LTDTGKPHAPDQPVVQIFYSFGKREPPVKSTVRDVLMDGEASGCRR